MTTMPKVDTAKLASELDAADLAVVLRCLNGGYLRASKPTVDEEQAETGLAAYVWRMAAFSVSPNPKHQCMPVTADFDLYPACPSYREWRKHHWDAPGYEEWSAKFHAEKTALTARGDRLEKALVNAVNVRDWHGVRRWGQAFGLIGEPRVAADGSIIYR